MSRFPQLGFGVFQIKPEDTVEAVTTALEVGYRHIDTAEMYRNEKEVGEAIATSGIDPSEIFVTSKLNNNKHDFDDALAAFDQTLADLRLDRIDLFLIHWPLPKVGDFVETWKALERVYSEGRARSIGVSNFQPHHLRRLHQETTVIPAVNQIELHPYLTQDELRAFDAEHGIATEAWSPIAQGGVLADADDHRPGQQLRQDARPRSCCAGTSSSATSCSRSPSSRAACGRTSRSSISSSPTPTCR